MTLPTTLRVALAPLCGALFILSCSDDAPDAPRETSADRGVSGAEDLMALSRAPALRSASLAAIGDSALDGDEECDDGNTASGDGCSSDGLIEGDFICRTPGNPCFIPVCEVSFVDVEAVGGDAFPDDNLAP
ncbi:MAG: cysteine-rich repeat protein, partial [Bradymonadia bacterium]